jgi:hypothetical protein
MSLSLLVVVLRSPLAAWTGCGIGVGGCYGPTIDEGLTMRSKSLLSM